MVADRGRESETVIVNGKWCNEIKEEKKIYQNSRTHWREMLLRHRHTNAYTLYASMHAYINRRSVMPNSLSADFDISNFLHTER